MSESLEEIITSRKISSDSGVNYINNTEATSYFENLYFQVREKEGRIYSDSIVKNLPNFEHSHPLYREWQIRGRSLNKLESYIIRKPKSTKILDLGCGNGWMANRLAKLPLCQVFAIDLNQTELEQGARVFSDTTSLHLIYGNIFENYFQLASFDLILMASSVQYFSDIQKLLNRLLELLNEAGEIHIMDSPFYTKESVSTARQRTIDYYQQLGYPEMTNYYYHHQWTELLGFHYKIKYKPRSYLSGFRQNFFKDVISPFPWIIISR